MRRMDGERIECHYLIIAPGREGADWLIDEANRLKLTLHNNPVDVGVRVEVPSAVLAELTDVLYEPKLEYFTPTFDDRVRTFCMCPGGQVTLESTGATDPVITVNGHSYAHRKTGNTNFALLVSTSFTEPFREPIAYGKYVARLANILGGGVIVQRLGDLLGGRRSTPAAGGAQHHSAHAEERHTRGPQLRAAVPASQRHRGDAPGHGQALSRGGFAPHPALRSRGQVLLLPAQTGLSHGDRDTGHVRHRRWRWGQPRPGPGFCLRRDRRARHTEGCCVGLAEGACMRLDGQFWAPKC